MPSDATLIPLHTIDYNLPERFALTYKGSDNGANPLLIYRALWKSRAFCGLFYSTYRWKFSLWLTPEQLIILSVSEKYEKYAEKFQISWKSSEIRALIDNRNETIGKKIETQLNKFPYMLIVGEENCRKYSLWSHWRRYGVVGNLYWKIAELPPVVQHLIVN